MQKLQNNKGFTLIELLVVITIIGILATGATATYTSQIQKARDTTRINDVKALQSGIEQFYQDSSVYPKKDNTSAGFGSGGVVKYVEKFPSDLKSGQNCNKGSETNPTPCDYLYNVKEDANGVSYQLYNLSTGFENSGNISSKAEKDNGVMSNRLEMGVGLSSFGSYNGGSPIAGTTNSCTNVGTSAGSYMLIRGNCN